MTAFTTRVILHGVKEHEQVYTDLHKAMDKAGFKRTVKGADDKEYDLPTAEYDFDGSITTEAVVDKAWAAASSVHNDCGVLVTKSAPDGQMWKGLKPA